MNTATASVEAPDPQPLPRGALPDRVIERLRREGVTSCGQWHALGRRRHQIFGITRAMVDVIDKAVKAAIP